MIEAVARQRWKIAILLSVGVLVNYFDRVNLSVSHDALCGEFGITDVTFGFLLGAYNWTYAALQLPSGFLLDRFGVRRVGCVSTFLWSVASFAAALSRNIGAFFGARFLLGVGEAPTFPANAKAIGYWFPPKQRSFATSLFDGAAKFSSAIGVPLIGLMLLHIGWRLSFAVTGLISFLYFLLFCRVYRDPHDGEIEHAPAAAQTEEHPDHPKNRALIGYLLRQRKVLGLAIGFGSYNYVFYLFLTWLPVYLSRSLHIDLAHSFVYTRRAMALCNRGRPCCGRMDGGFPDSPRMECGPCATHRAGGRYGNGTRHSGSRACAHAHPGTLLDQRLNWRIVCSRSGGMVGAVADCAGGQRGFGGRNSESFESDFRNRRTHCDRVSGERTPIVCGGILCGGRVPGGRHLAYIFLLGEIKTVPHPVRAA